MRNEQLLSLVEQAKTGDRVAFRSLCDAKIQSILYLCTRLTNTKQDAEDAAQEVLIHLYQRLPYLQSNQAFSVWLNRIVIATCADMQRKSKGKTMPIEEYTGELQETNLDFLPEEYLDNQNKRDGLLQAIRTLPYKQQQILLLFYFEDMSTRQISEVLRIKPKDVENRLHYARKRLRETVLQGKGAKANSLVNSGAHIALGQVLKADAAITITSAQTSQVVAASAAQIGIAAAGNAAATSSAATGWLGALQAVPALSSAVASTVAVGAVCAATAIGVAVSSVPPAGAVNNEAFPQLTSTIETASPQGTEEIVLLEEPTSGEETGMDETQSVPLLVEPQESEDSEAPTRTSTTYTAQGQLLFVGQSGEAVDGATYLAEGFTVSLYRSGSLYAKAVADEKGQYSLSFSTRSLRDGWQLCIQATPAMGNCFVQGQGGALWLDLQTPTELPDVLFTDTTQPTAVIEFYDAVGQGTDGSSLMPASARLTVADNTPTRTTWKILSSQGGQTLHSGEGEVVDLAALEFTPAGWLTRYVLRFTVTDLAGNTGEFEREFLLLDTV